MNELLKAPNAKQILARIPPDSLQYGLVGTTNPINVPLILDGYGKPIYYVPPAGLLNLKIAGQTKNTEFLQADGKFHTRATFARLSAYSASSGPDGRIP